MATSILSASRPQAGLARPMVAAQEAGLPTVGIAAAAAGSILAVMWLMAWARLSIEPFARTSLPYEIAAVLLTGLRLAGLRIRGRAWRVTGDLAESVGMFAAVALVGAVASYPIAALSHGFVDGELQTVDVALHFNWLAWYRLVAAHPALQDAGATAYESIFVTPALLFAWYAWDGRRREAHRFITGFWLAGVITLTLYSWMPAVGPFSFLWHARIPYVPRSGIWQQLTIPALRAHLAPIVDLGHLHGLVSAPSFHAASVVLYIAAAWRTPLRWPLLAVNLAMLLSTPVEGTHYLSDILLGAIVAVAAMVLADVILRVASPAAPAQPADSCRARR